MRLTGNRVMLLRIETESMKDGSIFLVDTYKKGSVMFQVLATGPGRWIKRKKKYVWIKPDVKPGDIVGSHHSLNATEHPDYHPPHCLDTADGAGRVVLDARFCECIFK
jgi:co-chaperonin GroES (HSP10)